MATITHFLRATAPALTFGGGASTFLLTVALSAFACAGEAQALTVRPQDDVWIVSTRGLCRCPASGETEALGVSRHEDCRWESRAFADLANESSPDRIDVLFVHGNRVEPNEVPGLIRQVYGALVACDGPAVRLIFWSWPSDQQGGIVNDVLAKDARTYLEIAWLREALSALPHRGVRSLVGYSFGARIVVAATANYDPASTALPPEQETTVGVPSAPRSPQRAILIAGALDRAALCPNGSFSNAYGRLDRLSVWFNEADPALKRYRLVDHGAEALGYEGLPVRWLTIDACRLDQTNVTAWIGRTHWLSEYLDDSRATSLLRRQALWEDAPPAEALTAANSPIASR